MKTTVLWLYENYTATEASALYLIAVTAVIALRTGEFRRTVGADWPLAAQCAFGMALWLILAAMGIGFFHALIWTFDVFWPMPVQPGMAGNLV